VQHRECVNVELRFLHVAGESMFLRARACEFNKFDSDMTSFDLWRGRSPCPWPRPQHLRKFPEDGVTKRPKNVGQGVRVVIVHSLCVPRWRSELLTFLYVLDLSGGRLSGFHRHIWFTVTGKYHFGKFQLNFIYLPTFVCNRHWDYFCA
jgi:hypothetical protein